MSSNNNNASSAEKEQQVITDDTVEQLEEMPQALKDEVFGPVTMPFGTSALLGKKQKLGKKKQTDQRAPTPKPGKQKPRMVSEPSSTKDAEASVPEKAKPKQEVKPCKYVEDHAKCKYGNQCRFVLSGGVVHTVTLASNLKECMEKFSYHIPDVQEVVELCKIQGQKVQVKPDFAPGTHPISHAARDVAFMKVLSMEMGVKASVTVLDWFGSDRNAKLAKLIVTGAVPGVNLSITAAPNTPIQGDSSRTAKSRVSLFDTDRFDFAVVQDVYSDGPSGRAPFTPDTVKKIASYTHSGVVYVICRFFNGEAGTDPVPIGKEPEMVWYREDGLIFASPDKHTACYPGHPDVNWLQLRHYKGVDVSPLFACGPYQVVRCSLALVGAQPLEEQKLPESTIQRQLLARWRVIPSFVSNWWNKSALSSFLRLPAFVEKPVHLPTCLDLSLKFNSKLPYGQSWDSAVVAVQSNFEQCPDLKAIGKRFPRFMLELTEGTAMAVLYGRRTDTADALSTLRDVHQPAEIMLSNARAQEYKRPRSYSAVKYLMVGIGVTYVGVKLWNGIGSRASPSGRGVVGSFVSENWFNILVVAPVVEEAIKFGSPEVGRVSALVELGMNIVHTNNWSGSLQAYLMHETTLALQRKSPTFTMYCVSVFIHFCYNLYCVTRNPIYSREKEEALRVFRDAYELGEKIAQPRSLEITLPAGFKLPALQSDPGRHLEVLRGSIEASVNGVKRVLDGLSKGNTGSVVDALADEPLHKTFIYAILITNGLMWRPQKSATNLVVSLATRIHNDPFKSCAPAKVRHANWKWLAQTVVDEKIIWGSLDQLEEVKDCVKKMGAAGKRILEADIKDHLGDNAKMPKSVMVKQDETIPANKNVGGSLTIKPRCITNLDPKFHSRTTQIARALADHFHSIWNENEVYKFHGVPVRIVFCSGYTGKMLSGLAPFLLDTTVVTILVSGDDSYVALGPFGTKHRMFLEGDASMFDQSQDEGPLREAAQIWMDALLLPRSFLQTLLLACSKPYVASVGPLLVRGEAGIQLGTGLTMTTVWNSVNNALMWLYCLSHLFKDCPARAAELGFTLKLREHVEFWRGTFLKGWWMKNTTGGWDWVVLPSAVIKLGKVMNDPRSITAVTKNGKKKKFDADKAVRIVAFGVSLSYGTLPLDYPILGTFLSVLREKGEWHRVLLSKKITSESQSHKALADVTSLDREFCLMAMSERYSVTRDDLLRVEELLRRIPRLPAYVEDEVFDRLVTVDYE